MTFHPRIVEMSDIGFLDEDVWIVRNHSGKTEEEARVLVTERLQTFVAANRST